MRSLYLEGILVSTEPCLFKLLVCFLLSLQNQKISTMRFVFKSMSIFFLIFPIIGGSSWFSFSTILLLNTHWRSMHEVLSMLFLMWVSLFNVLSILQQIWPADSHLVVLYWCYYCFTLVSTILSISNVIISDVQYSGEISPLILPISLDVQQNIK